MKMTWRVFKRKKHSKECMMEGRDSDTIPGKNGVMLSFPADDLALKLPTLQKGSLENLNYQHGQFKALCQGYPILI